MHAFQNICKPNILKNTHICYCSISIRFDILRVNININFTAGMKRLGSITHGLTPPTRWHRKSLCEKNAFLLPLPQ